MSSEKKEVKVPFGAALGVFLSIVAILILGIFVLKVDLHALLILGLVVTVLVSIKLGFTWKQIEDAMGRGVSRAMVAMFIFIMIGMIIGSWIHSGTVPALIYYGLNLLSPKIFLPAGLIICSLTSLTTGTSWGTAGTMGIALMGIGGGLGIPPEITAGMIISGAFFGDKMSPISDTTVLASVSAGTGLYDHIRAMMYSTVPAYIISLILYTVVGLRYAGGTFDAESVVQIQTALAENFNISIWLIIPMVVTLILSIKKVPAVPAMFTGTILGTITSLIFQGSSLSEALTAINYGFSSDTGVAVIDKLLNRGGIQSMMWTFSLAFIALALGGVLDEMGFMSALVEKLIAKIDNVANLITMTIVTTFISNAAMGECYLSLILNGRLYQKAYDEKGLARNMLSRVLEEGGTMTTGLIPWTTAGAFMGSTLGVSAFAFAPYAFLNWLNPIISIVLAYMGIFVLYAKDEEKKSPTARVEG